MAVLEIEVRGLEELQKRLGIDPLDVVEPAIQRATVRIEGRMKEYPPVRPGQRYRRGTDPRSERLGQRWTQRVMRDASSVTGEVGNNASYGPWVQSHEFQAWMHRGRWTTDQQALEDDLPELESDLNALVARALGG